MDIDTIPLAGLVMGKISGRKCLLVPEELLPLKALGETYHPSNLSDFKTHDPVSAQDTKNPLDHMCMFKS